MQKLLLVPDLLGRGQMKAAHLLLLALWSRRSPAHHCSLSAPTDMGCSQLPINSSQAQAHLPLQFILPKTALFPLVTSLLMKT